MEVFGFAHVGLAAPTALLLPVLSRLVRGRGLGEGRPPGAVGSLPLPDGRTAGGRVADRTPRLQRHLQRSVRARAAAVGARRVAVARQREQRVPHARVRRVAKPAAAALARRPGVRRQPALLPDHAERQLAAREPRVRPPRLRVPPGVEGGELVARCFFYYMWGVLHAEKLLPTQQPPPPTSAPSSRRRANRSALRRVGVRGARAAPLARLAGRRADARPHVRRAAARSRRRCSRRRPDGTRAAELVALQNAAAFSAPPTPPAAGGAAGALAAVVAGFVEDIECGVACSLPNFLASHSHSSRRATPALYLDFQLRLNNVSADLERLRRVMRYRQPGRVGDRVEVRSAARIRSRASGCR